MIHESIRKCEIVPVEFADPKDDDRVFRLVTVSSDYSCLHKKDGSGGSMIEHDLREILYLGPLWTGWIYNSSHELVGICRGIMLVNPRILQWIQSVKEELNTLTSPKWTTTAKNIAKKYEYKPRNHSSFV